MADEEAKRREARRRRIIVNSEDRMRRLLGRGKDNGTESNDNDLPNVDKTDNETEGDSCEKHEKAEDLCNTSEKTMEDTISQRIKTPNKTETHDDSSQSSRSTSPLRTDDDAEVADNEMNEKQQAKHQQLHNFMKSRQLLCFFCGVLVRLAFMYISLFQNIVFPFVAFEMAVFMYQKQNAMEMGSEVQGGLWLSTMVLSGVKPQIIETYKNIIGVLTCALDDFTVYFFAFVTTHVILPI